MKKTQEVLKNIGIQRTCFKGSTKFVCILFKIARLFAQTYWLHLSMFLSYVSSLRRNLLCLLVTSARSVTTCRLYPFNLPCVRSQVVLMACFISDVKTGINCASIPCFDDVEKSIPFSDPINMIHTNEAHQCAIAIPL